MNLSDSFWIFFCLGVKADYRLGSSIKVIPLTYCPHIPTIISFALLWEMCTYSHITMVICQHLQAFKLDLKNMVNVNYPLIQ